MYDTQESGFTVGVSCPVSSHVSLRLPPSFRVQNPYPTPDRWTLTQHLQVSDIIPNTYNIDYANIIVYLPSGRQYTSLIWTTYPISTGYATLPGRKWNVAFNNLTNAGIRFDKIRVLTDGGGISSQGVRASEGRFQTLNGPITGEYTIPPSHLTFNTNGGEPFSDK
jgi:hypothetical protein